MQMIRSSLPRVMICTIALIMAGPAFSQTAQGTTESAPPSEDLQPGQTYIRDAITDWNIRCMRGAGTLAEDTCQLYQLLNDPSGNPVSEFTVLPVPENEAGAAAMVTIITPLETVLTEGLILSIDGAAMAPRQFVWCNRTGCYARFAVSEEELAGMKRGAVATVSIVALAAPQQRIEVSASLRGFTAAFEQLSAEQLPQQ